MSAPGRAGCTRPCLAFGPMRQRPPPTGTCRLCDRDVAGDMLTLHHLRPKECGGTSDERTPLCRPCHRQLHATFSNKDLERQYASIETLRAAAALQAFLWWIRKQKAGRNFRTVTSNAHPKRGRKR